ncbi:hypothetical protein G9A89_001524, partial [Geosiphon pyriformis]
ATIGCSIAVIKKTAKVSVSDDGFRPVLPKKKKREDILENGSGGENVGSKIQSSHLWDSETGDTTKSNSVNIEEECLVEETSFDYGENGAFAGEDPNLTPTGSKIKTKKVLGKPLGKINFSVSKEENNVLLDVSLKLPLFLMNLVNISTCKFFVSDIGFDKVVGKSSQEKLAIIKKLFSQINGFGGASTSSKFAGIIKATFTSELSLAQASKKAEKAKILVNTNLKKSSEHSNRTVVLKEILIRTSTEAVRAVLSKFKLIKSIKMQLVGLWQKVVVEFKQVDYANLIAAKWSILIGKDTMHVTRSDVDKELWDT